MDLLTARLPDSALPSHTQKQCITMVSCESSVVVFDY